MRKIDNQKNNENTSFNKIKRVVEKIVDGCIISAKKNLINTVKEKFLPRNESTDYVDLLFICINKGVNNFKYHNPNFCYSERLLLWHELSLLAGFVGNIFISGDFNETMILEERWNGSGYTASMLALRELVNNSELLDLPLHGSLFTWQNSISKSRIDRCLVSATAGTLWPDMSLTALPNVQSDHVPICFRSANGFDWGLKPFRALDAWWDHSEFADFMKNNWDVACGNSPNLIQRLKDLRHTIKSWNSEVFGDQNKIIQDLSQKIQVKNLAAESRILLEVEKTELSDLKISLLEAEKRIESIWIQKSRVNVASNHYRNNYISSVVVDGTIFSKPKNICLYIREFYSKLCSRQVGVDFDISGLNFAQISNLQADSLVKLFEEAEIVNVLYSCGIKKAPGPNGFNFISTGNLGM
ncbi:uncharacterized protein LOC126671453 [Mercurialis annua]|uniref:uncharacterized protein LOC126671453 n=1 Tax=Mercurialis annua TaxID=3986 RepID=UPI00216016A1|nr:uncharacterized protein LOC126671453 [Mercurialis annua]